MSIDEDGTISENEFCEVWTSDGEMIHISFLGSTFMVNLPVDRYIEFAEMIQRTLPDTYARNTFRSN
jgi:hypothetical protein